MKQCPRCGGSGWQWETHPELPMDHPLANGKRCPGPGMPCEEPGCQVSGMFRDWGSLLRGSTKGGGLAEELERLSRQVLRIFGVDAYEAALLRTAAVAKQKPNDRRAWNLALRDELKRLLGPH